MSTKSTFETTAAAFIGSGERSTTKFPVAKNIWFAMDLADASGHQLAIFKEDDEIIVIRRSAKSWSTKPVLCLEDLDQFNKFNVTFGDQPDTLIITEPYWEGYYNIDLAKGKINMILDKPETGSRIQKVLDAAAEATAEAWGKAYAQALLEGVEAIHPLITTQDENEVGEPTTARAFTAEELAEINDKANRFIESCRAEAEEMTLNALANEALFIFEALSRIDKDAVQDLVHKVLKVHGAIALIWDTSDVLEEYPALTEEEARAVLEHCEALAVFEDSEATVWFSLQNAVEVLHPDYDKRAQEGAIADQDQNYF